MWIDEDDYAHFEGPQHINEDEACPWKQCEICGLITKVVHVQHFAKPDNPLDTYKRILCIKCGHKSRKFWIDVERKKTQKDMR